MPGPLSAPNGDARLTKMSGEERIWFVNSKKFTLTTGKTAKKKRKQVKP